MQYQILKKGDRYVLTRRNFMQGADERHELAPDEIEEILANKNKELEVSDVKYTLNDSGELLKNGRKVPKNRKQKFMHQLNALADAVFGPGKRHYRWEQKDDGEEHVFGNRMMVNVSEFEFEPGSIDNDVFDRLEYRVADGKDGEELLELLNGAADRVRENQLKNAERRKGADIEYGYDEDAGMFTINGKPMDLKQLKKFVRGLNGGIRDYEDTEYWEHFKISMKGSKVGDIANFSLPPVVTCNKDAPCITDGCYAVKAYGTYPSSRAAMDINLHLLKQGRFRQFVDELTTAINSKYKRTVGKLKEGESIGYFRFHVSGDAFSAEYFRAMCEVARNCTGVNFWTYTKQYAVLEECKSEIPGNMSVLVSCWGSFRPKTYMNGKYADLEKEFTLAYLNDNTKNTQDYIDKTDKNGRKVKPFTCPCTDYSDMEVRCDKCLRCYETNKLKNNLVFNKH